MAYVGTVLFFGMTTIAVFHIIYAMRRRRDFLSSKGPEEQVLDYGWGLKGFLLGAVGFWLITLPTVMILTQSQPDDTFWGLIAFPVVFPLWLGIAEAFGAALLVTPQGIRRCSPWSRELSIRWDEISSLSYNASMMWAVLKTPRCRIRISDFLRNREALMMGLQEHVTLEQLEAGFRRPCDK